MTSTSMSVGRQLLVALIANDEPEFIRILDAACRQMRGNRLATDAEIDRLTDQLRAGETALGLAHDPASCKMVRAQLQQRLAPNQDVLLAA